MSLVNKQKVQDILVGMFQRATASDRFSALRELIARLNYEPAQEMLKLDLPESVDSDSRPQSVMLIGLGGSDNAFHIIHARFSTPTLSRVSERTVIGSLLQKHPYSLFVFSNNDQTLWHFVNVKVAKAEATDENREAKLRRLFRRITVGPMEQLRTATERIELLDLEHIAGAAGDLFGLSPLAIQLQHETAFDVEAVTDQFFKLYKEIFESVMGSITGLRGKESRTYFTQRLFNRLMFIAFIQKKGWLRFASEAAGLPNPSPADYLYTLWADYAAKKKDDSNFYNERLRRLFFHALNTPNETNQTGIRGTGPNKTLLQRVIGDVPYLNGGLFEYDPDGTDEDMEIVVPDKAIKSILHDLFQRFNFTVTESTPLDVEVAVDPEMLGKVFEELVTGRHETGAYYTPKPIVSFMGREALKGYLQTKLPKETADAVAAFVDDHKAAGLKDPERVLEALKKATICDPACGSGAYLLGMLHELLDLRACLFASVKLDAPDVYDRKLEIIQNNLYGVDIEQFAINIARLRLWLSLAVDFNGDVAQLPPLPNLDFKIERGDSVCGPDPSGGFQLSLHQQGTLSDFLEKKGAYLKAHHEDKRRLWKEILKVREKLKDAAELEGVDTGFLWVVEFAEVFADGGFDVVVANPPYVRHELIAEIKPRLEEAHSAVYTGTADLYCYFFSRAIQMLKAGGMMAFISSNKWFRAGYAEKLRKFLISRTAIACIVDFGDLPVFQTATTFPTILVAKRSSGTKNDLLFAAIPSLDSPYPDVRALVLKNGAVLSQESLGSESWNAAPKERAYVEKLSKKGVPLIEYAKGLIYYGVKTGCNDAFYLDSETRRALIKEDPRSSKQIKRLAVGDDIGRWVLEPKDQWLIYSPWDLDIKQFPALKEHLQKWKTQLQARPECRDGRYKWWCMARYGAEYAHLFEKPKILYQEIATYSRFALDLDGHYINNKVFMIASDDRFLLGVLNSAPAWRFLGSICGRMIRGAYAMQLPHVSKVPIPHATTAERRSVSDLVQKCLDAKGVGCEVWEKEIDERVSALYGL